MEVVILMPDSTNTIAFIGDDIKELGSTLKYPHGNHHK